MMRSLIIVATLCILVVFLYADINRLVLVCSVFAVGVFFDAVLNWLERKRSA